MATYSAYLSGGAWGIIYLELAQVSQNIANNTSTVSYTFYTKSRSSSGGFYNYYHTGKTSIVINGKTVHSQSGRDFDVRNGKVQQLASGTTTVAHNENGTKSFSFSASLWSSGGTGNISGNFTLSKIPRASSFSLQNTSGTNISSIYAGNTVKIAINKKVSSFTHTIKLSYSGTSETVANKTTSNSVNWSNSENVMTNYMKNLKSMNLIFTLETYDGSTRIGSSSKNLTLNVPSSAGPVINNIDVTEANQNKINIIGSSPFYQLLSDLKVSTSASGKYGASIKSVNVSLGNLTKSGNSVIFSNLNLKGNQDIKVAVQDSRGLSASTTKTVNLSPYNLPNISFFNAYRNQSNTKYASARISLTATVIDNKNPLSVKVDVAEKDSNSWRNVYSATVGNGSFNSTISLGGGFDDFKAYDVRLSIADKFKRHQAISSIPTTSQSLVIGANKPVVGIGKVPSIDKGLDVDGVIKVGDFIAFISGDDVVLKNSNYSGNIRIENDLKLDGNINFTQGNDKKIINLNLLNGLSGFIKAKKDPLGGVTVWGVVKLSNIDYIHRNASNWAVLPAGYRPNSFVGFSLNTYKSGARPVVAQGMGCNSDGEIYYKGIKSVGNELNNGYNCYFSFYFKAEGAW